MGRDAEVYWILRGTREAAALCDPTQGEGPRAPKPSNVTPQPSGSLASTTRRKAPRKVLRSRSPGSWSQREESESLKCMIMGGRGERMGGGPVISSVIECLSLSSSLPPSLAPSLPSPCLLHKELLRRNRTNAPLCGSPSVSGSVRDSCLQHAMVTHYPLPRQEKEQT